VRSTASLPRARTPRAAALGGHEVVIDVQTHFVADRPECRPWHATIRALYGAVRPGWWRGLDALAAYDLEQYLRCVFVESETALAVLTSAPGHGPDRMLNDRELAGTRELADRLGGGGRLLSHAIVHPDVPGEIETFAERSARLRPVGWKVYTLGQMGPEGAKKRTGWSLDDASTGPPFLERVRASGVRRVCVHKGISYLVPTGSPRDVGPAAAAFPDLDFLIYHSGYEVPLGDVPPEGPFSAATAGDGTNRLVASLRGARIPPGGNVWAELGSTWFCLIRRPEEAAHVLGKLLLAVGEDRVLWGTDAIWYGPSQTAIDAFRAFQIPEAMRERLAREGRAREPLVTGLRRTGVDGGGGGPAPVRLGLGVESAQLVQEPHDVLLVALEQLRCDGLHRPSGLLVDVEAVDELVDQEDLVPIRARARPASVKGLVGGERPPREGGVISNALPVARVRGLPAAAVPWAGGRTSLRDGEDAPTARARDLAARDEFEGRTARVEDAADLFTQLEIAEAARVRVVEPLQQRGREPPRPADLVSALSVAHASSRPRRRAPRSASPARANAGARRTRARAMRGVATRGAAPSRARHSRPRPPSSRASASRARTSSAS
jgi:predicted TIM-barrel fold metal-dependent hydrolase